MIPEVIAKNIGLISAISGTLSLCANIFSILADAKSLNEPNSFILPFSEPVRQIVDSDTFSIVTLGIVFISWLIVSWVLTQHYFQHWSYEWDITVDHPHTSGIRGQRRTELLRKFSWRVFLHTLGLGIVGASLVLIALYVSRQLHIAQILGIAINLILGTILIYCIMAWLMPTLYSDSMYDKSGLFHSFFKG